MLDFFLNPQFLAAGAALISVPIIIHLINRLRFKRLRWAAMEFLLKAQKRNRRRLIIEQLILLALRCFLVFLAALLVMRFVGFSFAEFGTKQALHLVLLDDTLSMNDQWKEGDDVKDCFKVAKKEILLDKIARGVGQSTSSDKLMVLPLTRILDLDQLPDAERNKKLKELTFDKLNDEGRFKKLKEYVDQIEPTLLHANLVHGVKLAREIAAANKESLVTLHILSDFRQKDWGQAEGETLHKELAELVKLNKTKVTLIDAAHPYRTTGQGGAPQSHDNVGIIDLRPDTRIAGKDMKDTPVTFTITLANYSAREADVNIAIYDDNTGKEQLQITQEFNPPLPIKVPAGGTAQATFDLRLSPQLKPGEPYFAQISAHLESPQRGKLENDGLPHDNVRHAAIEIRDQVPVLIIDGEGKAGRDEDKDSYFVKTALISVPGTSYKVDFGDMLGGSGGLSTKALERADLRNYPTIYLLNVRDLTPKQLANLETYVREGGGVGFFLGPQVSAPFYNQFLYKEGQGIFPAPLKDPYFPPPNQEMLQPTITGTPMLLLRDEMFPSLSSYPIFGQVFKDPEGRSRLNDLPVKRYFQVPRSKWRQQPGKVFELATLPNDLPVGDFRQAILGIVRNPILQNEEFKRYGKGLERHRRIIESVVEPGSEKKPYHLALVLDEMLADKGNPKEAAEFPNLTEFWSQSDPKVRSLRQEVVDVRDQARYGDPFVVSSNYGKGRVVGVVTTAGRAWNDWGGSSAAASTYQPFIWEMQKYLSSQTSEANLSVGTPVDIVIDSEPYKQDNRRLKMSRFFYKAERDKEVKVIEESEQFGVDKQGTMAFSFPGNREPGLYVAHLQFEGDKEKKLVSWAHVFNVDTVQEGPLQRVSYEDLKANVIDKGEGRVRFEGAGVQSDDLVPRRSDLSESPLFFLLFLAILVAEQALAVHLSFHLKGSEGEMLAKVTQPRAAA